MTIIEVIDGSIAKWTDEDGPIVFDTPDSFLKWWFTIGSQKCPMCHYFFGTCSMCLVSDGTHEKLYNVYLHPAEGECYLEYCDDGVCCKPWQLLQGCSDALRYGYDIPLDTVNCLMRDMRDYLLLVKEKKVIDTRELDEVREVMEQVNEINKPNDIVITTT